MRKVAVAILFIFYSFLLEMCSCSSGVRVYFPPFRHRLILPPRRFSIFNRAWIWPFHVDKNVPSLPSVPASKYL